MSFGSLCIFLSIKYNEIKKIFVAILSTALMLSLVSAVSASDNSNIKVTTEGVKNDGISPRDSIHIPPQSWNSTGAYSNEFTTAPQNGKFLNVWVKNSGTSTVYVTIKRNNSDFTSSYALSKGDQNTFAFEDMMGTGLTGDWKVYIYNSVGAANVLTVSARQF